MSYTTNPATTVESALLYNRKNVIRTHSLRSPLCWVLLLVALTACGQSPVSMPTPSPAKPDPNGPTDTEATISGEVVVFAVAPFAEVFPAIGQRFDAIHGTTTLFNIAGGPQLVQQIAGGADVDLFAYNENHLQNAIDTGRVISGTESVIARSRPILAIPADNPANIASLEDLAQPGIKIVFGTEETAIGQYALMFLNRAEESGMAAKGYKDAVLANVVSYEPSVRAVLAKVLVGEADAAIVYTSDVGHDSEQVQALPLPESLVAETSFYLTPISNSPNPQAAQAFIDYVRSPDGQAVLKKYGFLPGE